MASGTSINGGASLTSRYVAVLAAAALGAVLYAGAAQTLGVRAASLAAITAMLVAIAVYRPLVAVGAVILLSPLDVAGRIAAEIPWLTYSRVAIVGALVAVVLVRWAAGDRLKWPTHLWAPVVFIALGVFGLLQSGLEVGSMISVAGIVMPFAMVFIIVQLTESPADVRFFLWAIALSSVVPIVFGALDVATGQSFLGTATDQFLAEAPGAAGPTETIGGLVLWRITSTFTVTAAFARFLTFAFAATIGLLPSAKKSARVVLLVLAAGQILCIAGTFTRTAYVAVAVIVVAAIILIPQWRRYSWAVAALALAGVAFLIPRIGPFLSATRLSSISDNGRFVLWANSLEAAIARPVFGYGFGNAASVLGQTGPLAQEPHNLVLEALLSAGVFGAVVLAGYLLWLLVSLLMIEEGPLAEVARPVVLMLTAVIISGLFMHALFSDEIWITIGVAAAVLAVRGVSLRGDTT